MLNGDWLEELVVASASSSVKYGDCNPVYNLDLIQDELVTKLYGKRRFTADVKHYASVQYAGTISGNSNSSSIVTDLRMAGFNEEISELHRHRVNAAFNRVKAFEENSFYGAVKSTA